MAEHDTAGTGPVKITTQVAKFEGDRMDQDPFETVVLVAWYEPDGREVTDPARIAELETKLTERSDAPCP